ncbi:FAD-dependent monooxygenase [Streptomyces sp. TS71-3]|uniref:FAD-dependent monooxygenase n=1 Tax=Streptomyces sp. TS71-3 TaxID=2733862 RepID=UPI001B0A9041|nr:FAD-dependent monooxygenase [Streptomyces sp. TS71-3]GHJ39052.1 monooxygenase [Streptomyces sp. TS71-3]
MRNSTTGGAGERAPRAVVIGGGIGGLTAAVGLHRRGWRVTVLERAGSLAPVGAAIALSPNALRALDVIGAGKEVRALAAWEGDGGLRTPSGRWLARTDAERNEARFGGPLVLLRRSTLVDLLAARLPDGAVRTGSQAALADVGDPGHASAPGAAEPGGAPPASGRPARVTTPDGDLEAELAVAADGVHSGARAVLFPDHPGPSYAGFTTWRLMVPAPGPFAPHETWGRGLLWGTQPLKDGSVYAYAAAAAPPGGHAPDDERAELRRFFGHWHEPVPSLIDAVPADEVLRHDVHHLATPLPALHRGRVAVLGDAAHAMPPTLGQGGNQAVEDAVVLAHHADPAAPAPDLAGYTRDRLPRTTAIAARSVSTSRMMITRRSAAAVALRNGAIAVLSTLFPAVMLRSFDEVAGWRPPGATYASPTSEHTP